MAAASLLVRLGVDLGNLKPGVDTAVREFDRLKTSVTQMGDRMIGAFPKTLGTEAKNIGAAVGTLVGSFGGLGGVVGALGLSALANDFFNTTGALVDLNAQTDISIRDLQRFKFAAEQSGSSLDVITSAVGQLQNRLGSMDKSATAALATLGLSIAEVLRLDPGQQFELIANRISEIPEPTRRAALAMDLFGRTGIQLLPVLRNNLTETGNQASVMSERTVVAADKADDLFGRLTTFAKVGIGEALFGPIVRWVEEGQQHIYNLGVSFDVLRGKMDALPTLKPIAPRVAAAAPVELMTVEEALRLSDQLTNKVEASIRKSEEGARRTAEAWADGVKSISDSISGALVVRDLKQWIEALSATGTSAKTLADSDLRQRLSTAIDTIILKFGSLKAAGLGALTPMAAALKAMGQQAETIPQPIIETIGVFSEVQSAGVNWRANLDTLNASMLALLDSGKVFKETFTPEDFKKLVEGTKRLEASTRSLGDAFASIGPIIVGAIQGGGNVLQSIGASLGTDFGSLFGDKLAKAIGGTFGKTLGGMLGPLGAIGGQLLGGLFDKLFSSAGRARVEEFAGTFGGFDALRTRLNDLGAEGERLWVNLTQRVGKGNVEQAQSAIAAIERALEAHKVKAMETEAEIAAARQRETDAIDAATAGVRSRIADLDSEYQSLFRSIENEAPEEVIGIIEAQARARMEAIKDERKTAESELDRITKQMEESFRDVADSAVIAARIIKDAFSDMLPGIDPQTSAPSGATGKSFLVGRSFSSGVSVPIGGGGGSFTTAKSTPGDVYLDGEKVGIHVERSMSKRMQRRQKVTAG